MANTHATKENVCMISGAIQKNSVAPSRNVNQTWRQTPNPTHWHLVCILKIILYICSTARVGNTASTDQRTNTPVTHKTVQPNLSRSDLQEDQIKYVSGYFNKMYLFWQSHVRGANTIIEKQNFPGFEHYATLHIWIRSFISCTLPKIGYNMEKILGKIRSAKIRFYSLT
jgi:hypothetical protein